MRILGIITARGGSKGIPGKNLALLAGRPLLAWTAQAALSARRLTRLVLSTDDETIAAAGKGCGLEVPFLRPPELARDDTPTIPVLQHVVRTLEAQGQRYDAVFLLQPTNPLRRAEDIDGAIDLLESTGADSVLSMVNVGEKHPARMKIVTPDGRVLDPPFAETREGQRRQDLPPYYLREGSVYLTRTAVLMEQNSLKGRDCRAWLVPPERACAIDTPLDLLLAEQLLRQQACPPPTRALAQPARLASPTAPDNTPPSTPSARGSRRPHVLIAESSGFSGRAAQRLQEWSDPRFADIPPGVLADALGDVEILWVRLRHTIDARLLDAAPRLRMIVTATTGLNHIDLEAAAQRRVRVLSLRGETDFLKEIRATAELTVGLLLALLRRIPWAAAHVLEGGWNRDGFRGAELCGKTVGIVGYGRLGRLVARYLAAFDATLLATDPAAAIDDRDAAVRGVSLEQLLAESDLVTLHVNLSPQTCGFFGRSQFAAMRPGAWLVNTARGELLDEAALEEALRSGRLAGAALDVLSRENAAGMSEHPLVAYARHHDNLVLTPHIGGCTAESMAKTEDFLAEKLASVWNAPCSDLVPA